MTPQRRRSQQQPARGLLDTSVFIADESGRALDESRIPSEVATSVVTLAEIHVGVLAADDVDTRARRLAMLEAVGDIELIPIDERVAAEWARMRIQLARRRRRVNVNDLWIAATAVVHDLPVVTQDDDFAPLRGIAGLSVIRV